MKIDMLVDQFCHLTGAITIDTNLREGGKLDLGVVDDQEFMAGGRDEAFTDASGSRHILQVRVVAAGAAGVKQGVEMGVDPRLIQLGHEVAGLFEFAIIQQGGDQLGMVAVGLQDFVGR